MAALEPGVDRGAAVSRLRAAFDDGQFDQETYDSRVAQVLAVSSQSELDQLLADVPALPQSEEPAPTRWQKRRARRRPRRILTAVSLALSGFLLVSAALYGLQVPLPQWWPLIGVGLMVLVWILS